MQVEVQGGDDGEDEQAGKDDAALARLKSQVHLSCASLYQPVPLFFYTFFATTFLRTLSFL